MLYTDSKRKNDTPVNRWRKRLSIALSVAFVLGLLVYRLIQFQRASEMPAALLVYVQTTGERYALNLQTGERFLTNSEDHHYGPEVLPDGQWRIAYWLATQHQSLELEAPLALQSMDNPKLFLDTGRLSMRGIVSWSSDSQWIVFRSRAANCFSDHLDSPYTELPATLRPREEYCLKDNLNRTDLEASELWLFNIRTAEAMVMTNNDVAEYTPLFSPRQPQIVYIQEDGLYLYDVDAQQGRRLFAREGVGRASWSPDAQWIAFTVSVSKTVSDLYIIRPDGTGEQRVATNLNPSYGFHWVP